MIFLLIISIISLSVILYFIFKKNNSDQPIQGCYQNCNNNGKCDNGVCTCDDGYTGNYCSIKCPSQCKLPSGVCSYKGDCKCQPGYSGLDCSTQICANCNKDGGYCKDSSCICNDGFVGPNCSTCDIGYSTPLCKPCPKKCSHPNGVCESDQKCKCNTNWSGESCDTCELPFYSTDVNGNCNFLDKEIKSCYLTFSDISADGLYFYITPNDNSPYKHHYEFMTDNTMKMFKFYEDNTGKLDGIFSWFNTNILTDSSLHCPFYDYDGKVSIVASIKLKSQTVPIIFNIIYNDKIIGTVTLSET